LMCAEFYRIEEGQIVFSACGVDIAKYAANVVVFISEARPSSNSQEKVRKLQCRSWKSSKLI